MEGNYNSIFMRSELDIMDSSLVVILFNLRESQFFVVLVIYFKRIIKLYDIIAPCYYTGCFMTLGHNCRR